MENKKKPYIYYIISLHSFHRNKKHPHFEFNFFDYYARSLYLNEARICVCVCVCVQTVVQHTGWHNAKWLT